MSCSATPSTRATAARSKLELGLGRVPRVGVVPAASCSAASPRRVRRSTSTSARPTGEIDRLVRALARGRGRADAGWLQAPGTVPTGSCSRRTRPTATTRSSSTARSSAWPAARSARSTATSPRPSPATSATGTARTTCVRSSAGSPSRCGWFGTTRGEGARLRGARCASCTATTARARSSIEGAPARDDLPEPLHRRDPGLRHPAGRPSTNASSTRPRCSSRAAPEHEQADAVAVDRLGRPGRACCWPTTPRCTSATSAASQSATRSGSTSRRGMHRERPTRTASPIGGATDETAHARVLGALQAPDGGADVSADRWRRPSCSDLERARPEVEQFLYREARLADEHDYDALGGALDRRRALLGARRRRRHRPA